MVSPYVLSNASATDCSSYVSAAFTLIQAHSPNDKGAVIWFEDSQVEYMNHDFSSEIDNKIRYDLALKHVNGNPRPFTRMTNKLLLGLAAEASGAYKYAGWIENRNFTLMIV